MVDRGMSDPLKMRYYGNKVQNVKAGLRGRGALALV